MRSRTALLAVALTWTAPALGVPQDMYIESCNLGCSDGSGGGPITCSFVSVFVNQDFRVRFSRSVAPESLGNSTFRIVDVSNGVAPIGTLFVDPADDRTVVFRPEYTVDMTGNLESSLDANTAYEIVLPGRDQGDSAPYVRSTDGQVNRTRMKCTVFTDLGVFPPVWPFCPVSPNSAGPGATMGASTDTSIASNSFQLFVSGGVPGELGVFFMGNGRTQVAAGDGTRCVGGLAHRFLPPAAFDTAGDTTLSLDLAALPPAVAGGVFPGATWYFQMVYRDPHGPGAGFNFTEAMQVQFYP